MTNNERFIPSKEQWVSAEAEARNRAPLPETSTALVAAYGFFGGSLVAYLAQTFAGASLDSQVTGAVSTGMGVLCGLVGYWIIRQRQREHNDIFARVLQGYEDAWRIDQKKSAEQ
ncbi:MAG: hypothetical protein DI616_07680 [Paracoccus denitrificans]|uniref:Uncharacterized protein n=1 Tax=Paracoccus denitrificans TaxID=266 RepID=A0A533IBF0_PARDE|nr:MAG: hypothetical protein DI616_07680 [Paracoccus denitrificans]